MKNTPVLVSKNRRTEGSPVQINYCNLFMEKSEKKVIFSPQILSYPEL